MAAICHLGFVEHILGWPERVFRGLCHCAKFRWNCCSGFDSTKVWIFCAFGVKRLIPAPKMQLLGAFDPQDKMQYKLDFKRHFLVRKYVIWLCLKLELLNQILPHFYKMSWNDCQWVCWNHNCDLPIRFEWRSSSKCGRIAAKIASFNTVNYEIIGQSSPDL